MQRTKLLISALPALFLIVPLSIVAVVGCNSSGNVTVGPVDAPFAVDGVIVRDDFLNRTTVAARVLRDGDIDGSLTVSFAGDTLTFDAAGVAFDSVFSRIVDSVNHYPVGIHPLVISSGSQTVRLLVDVPGMPVIDTVNPPTPPGMTGPQNVNLEWFAAANVDGYVMTATKANETYIGTGHREYAGFGGTFGTILQSSFFVDTSVIDPQLDTGLWYLSVYGYTGAPYKEFADEYLPVPFPSQLPDNIDTLETRGAFGIISVSPFEILQVSVQ